MLTPLLFCCALLTGCASNQTITPVAQVEVRTPAVPQYLRHCSGNPTVPSGNPIKQSAVAVYIVKLKQRGDECATKLDGVDKILTDAEADAATQK